MGFKSLHHAFLMLSHPVMWIYPAVFGILTAVVIYLNMICGIAAGWLESISIFVLFITPFLNAGTYGCIKSDNFTIGEYLRSAKSYYFRILLPSIVVAFLSIIVIMAAMIPVMMGGAALPVMSGALLGVFLFFMLTVYFYDAAAVFEDKKILECIRKSASATLLRPLETIVYYIINLLIGFVIFFIAVFIWTFFTVDSLTPVLSMNETQILEMSENPEIILNMTGEMGIYAGIISAFIGVFLLYLIMVPYKAAFYRDVLQNAVLPENTPDNGEGGVKGDVNADSGYRDSQGNVMHGEYDEKGRWYKYS